MKKTELYKELQGLTAEDLEQRVKELEHEMMNLRFRKASGQIESPARIKTIRRSIAQAKTVQNESRN